MRTTRRRFLEISSAVGAALPLWRVAPKSLLGASAKLSFGSPQEASKSASTPLYQFGGASLDAQAFSLIVNF